MSQIQYATSLSEVESKIGQSGPKNVYLVMLEDPSCKKGYSLWAISKLPDRMIQVIEINGYNLSNITISQIETIRTWNDVQSLVTEVKLGLTNIITTWARVINIKNMSKI